MANNVVRQLSIFINDKEVVNSLSGIGRALSVTNKEIRNLDATSETFNEDLARLKKQSEELQKAQAGLKQELYGTTKALEVSTNSLEGVEQRMKEVAKELRLLDSNTEDYQDNLAALKNEYSDLEKFQKAYAQDISLTTQATKESATGLDRVKERMQEVSKELNTLDTSSEDYRERLEKLGNEYKDLEKEQKHYQQEIKAATSVQEKQVNSLAHVEKQIQEVGNEMRNLDRDSANYREEIKRLKTEEAKLTQQHAKMNQEIHGSVSIFASLKSAIGPVGSSILAAFSVAGIVSKFTDGIADAWHTVVTFNQKQADLAAVLGKSQSGIRNLTADAIKFGSSTAYSATEVSELQTELARLGKTEPEIRKMTLAILNSATALESGLGEAAQLVGGQLNSFQEDASQAQKYADIMANSVNISATSFESLSTALPKVSAVAFQSDVSFEKLNATLGTLADQNIAAETAGTGFRNILLTSAEAGVPYEELLQQIKGSTNQLSTATGLFGKENATVAVILANSTEKVNANTKALENSGGAAEKLAKEKLNSLQGSLSNLSGAWEGFLLTIEKGDGALAKFARRTIDAGTALLSLLTPTKQLSDELRTEQLELNKLVSKITSSNVSNQERKQLLIQLKQEYPDFIKNIDIETVSNKELNSSLSKVNNEYVKRIALQKQQEKVDAKAGDKGYALQRELEAREKLFDILNRIKAESNLEVNIDYSKIIESAQKLKAELKAKGLNGVLGGDFRDIDFFSGQIKIFEVASKAYQKSIDEETVKLNRMAGVLGVVTEAQKTATEETKEATKAVVDKSEVENAILEKQIKDLTYLKNRREAAGKDTYNAQAQIFRLQQKLYKDDKDKYEEATVGLIKLDKDKNDKIAEASEKARKDEADRYKKFLEEQIKIAKANLDLYIANNQSPIKDGTLLTQKILDEEAKRLEGIKQAKLQELMVEKGTNEAVIALKQSQGIDLNAQDVEYLTAKQNLELENLKATDALKKEYADQQKQLALEQAEIDYELSIANADSLEEEERLRREKSYKDEKDRYKKLLDEKKITAQQFSQFVDRLDKDQKAAERARELQRVGENLGALNSLAGAVGGLFGQSKELAIAQAGINGALAITSILAQYPKFDGGFAMYAAIAASVLTTAKSLKDIQKQKAPKAAKFFDGGFTGDQALYNDKYGKVTQVNEYHANEWVMPNVMLRQPRYANVAGWLEAERKQPGSGGALTTDSPSSTGGGAEATAMLIDVVAQLTATLQGGIKATTVVGYETVRDINKMNNEISASGANGTLNKS